VHQLKTAVLFLHGLGLLGDVRTHSLLAI
jgi:hypothetical protein